MSCIAPMGVVVFDLDDTLFSEHSFTLSGIDAVCGELHSLTGEDCSGCGLAMARAVEQHRPHFDAMEQWLAESGLAATIDVKRLVETHRNHIPPFLPLKTGARELLDELSGRGYVLGIITDGREKKQSRKIEALGIRKYFNDDDIIISEAAGHDKKSPKSFLHFMRKYPGYSYYYIGDNPEKDFIQPLLLGWTTIGLADDGNNVVHHDLIPGMGGMPDFVATRLDEVSGIVFRERALRRENRQS